jgi:ubiquinone/menaquinone biosynthesis C-methylase UbiE
MTAPSPDPARHAYGRFGRISAAYDAGRRGFPRAAVAFVVRQLAGENPLVLDLACGTGIASRQLADNGFEVIGCDIDPLMLRYATGRGGARIRYVIGRAEAIPFKDASFDAVATFCGYHWFDPAGAVPEMTRVLRPDGRIAIVNIKGGDTLYEDFRKLVARFVGGELPDHRKGYDPKRDLRAHGLRILDEHSEREQQTATPPELCMQLQSVSVWNLIPEDRLAEARAALAEFCQARADGGTATRVIIFDTIVAAR